MRQSITTDTLFYGDDLAIMREYIPDESVDLVYLGPRRHGCGPENVKVRDTSLSPASVLVVNIPLRPSESDENGSQRPPLLLLMGRAQEPYRGLSPLIFDLLPNPSIDHLVAVILKYPRREESDWRKSLNPGSTG